MATNTYSGVSPLTIANALAKPIKKLIQYGKVTTSGGDMYCNNGKLVAVDDELPSGYERQIGFVFAASTYYLISGFHLRGSDTVRFSFSANKSCSVFGCFTTNSAADNYSLFASIFSDSKYLRYDGATYNSYIPSAQVGERIDVVITPTGTSGMPTDSVITPVEFEATADLCIGTTSASESYSSFKLDGNIWGNFVVDGRLTLIPCKRLSDDALGYYDLDSDTFYEPVGSAPTSLGVDTSHLTALSVEGTAEVLSVGAQTTSVANLFAAGDVKDEQDIISGVVTRKTEVVVSGGVITVQALAEPVTEQTTAQPLNTAKGDNTVSVTSNVDPVELSVEVEIPVYGIVDSTQLDTDLTSVANAIRTKGGTSAQLAFPTGFVDAIDAIETGGGSSSYSDMVNAFAKKEISGDIVLDSSVTDLPHQYFVSQQPITSFRADGLKLLNAYTFQNCTLLESIQFPALENIAAQCFDGCSALKMACFPKLGTGSTAYFYSSTFANCSSLQIADLGVIGALSRGLTSQVFKGCSSLKTLILRKSDGICPLGNINCFQSSTFDSTGTGGTLYVPSAQIANYQAATNWSTILGYANNQILPIEGSIYETQYADGTPIT